MDIKIIKPTCDTHEFQFDRMEHGASVFTCTRCGLEVKEFEDTGHGG